MFFRVFYKKSVCVGLLNERENVGLNLGAGVDCDRFWSCDELGGMEAVFPKMEGDIVFS